eukprot:5616549-Lingulodinium_polyedra.AAC.1
MTSPRAPVALGAEEGARGEAGAYGSWSHARRSSRLRLGSPAAAAAALPARSLERGQAAGGMARG